LLKEPVKIGLGIILDLDSSTLLAELDDTNASPQSPLHFLDGGPDIRVRRLFFFLSGSSPIRGQALDQPLHLTHGKPLRRRFLGDLDLLFGGWQAENGSGLSHGETMFSQEQLNFRR
jgi:hypothetical protein